MARQSRIGRFSTEAGVTMVEYLCVLAFLNVALLSVVSNLGTESKKPIDLVACATGGGSVSTIGRSEGYLGAVGSTYCTPSSGLQN